MDISLSEDHRLIKDTINRYVREGYGFEDRMKTIETETGWSQEHYGQLAELGLIAAVVGEDAGGIGGTALDIMIVMEELGRGLIVEPFIATAILGAGCLEAIGGHEELLEGVIGGETKLAFAHYEYGARYSSSIATTATASGDGYSLKGEKSVVLSAAAADYILVTAKVDGEDAIFLVDGDAVEIRDYQTADGSRAGEVTLDDVEVGAGALLAKGEAATAAITTTLNRGTLAVSAESIGAMEVARDMTIDYLKTRSQFGIPIGKFQALQHRTVDFCLELEQARSIVMLGVNALDTGENVAQVLAAMKAKVGQAGRLVAEESIQMHGGIGMTYEYALGHFAKRLIMIDHLFGDVDHHMNRFMALKAA